MTKTVSDRDIVFGFYHVEADTFVGSSVIARPGYVCVALQRPKKGSKSRTYRVAASFGSPLDTLNRRRARQIAKGRLLSDRVARAFTVRAVKVSTALADVFAEAMRRILSNRRIVPKGPKQMKTRYAPQWVHEALAQGRELTPLVK